MKNVSPIHAFEHVVIEAGAVIGSSDPTDVGKFKFLVAFHDEEGGVFHDYIGVSHEEALKSANGWEVPVFDLSHGRRAAS